MLSFVFFLYFWIKYNLKRNITMFCSIAHDFFTILTAEMVNEFKTQVSI